MADDRNKIELNIRNSINTDTFQEDFKDFSDTTAPLLENTGIERDGGITNIYRNQTDYPEAGQYVITQDDKVISIINSTTQDYKVVKIDGKAIGQVSAYGVEKTIELAGYDDVFLTSTSYITCSLVDNAITIKEFDFNETLLNTRTVTFTNLSSVLSYFTSLSFVRYEGMKYSDSLEWCIRLGDQVVILQESNPGITIAKALQSSDVLGTNAIKAAVVYNNQLILAGVGGRIGSYDGNNWKKYDGTGSGTGIYNAGDATLGVVGSNDINCLVNYSSGGVNYLVVGGNGGRIGSYNGTSWNKWDSGNAISNNATVISTDNVTTLTSWTPTGNTSAFLIVGGSAGKLGSWDGINWKLYNAASGICDNATLIGAVSINAIMVYTDYNGDNTLCVAGASGRVGSAKFTAGTTWSFVTTAAPGGNWTSIAYGNGVWIATASTTSTTQGIARSVDGISWSFITTPTPGGNWKSVAYGNGVWIAVAYTTSTTAGIARSTDNGLTWSFITTTAPGGNWISVAYGGGIFIAVAGTTSTTAGLARSTDGGLVWSFITTTTPGGNWNSIAYGNGVWIAVATTTSTTTAMARSTDNGLTWLFITTTSVVSWNSIAYGNGVWIAAVKTGISTTTIVKSIDNGLTWINSSSLTPGGDWYSVAYGNGIWIAVANTTSTTAGIATSPDGITWTFRTTTAPGGSGWFSVAYGNNIFIATSITTSTTAGLARSTIDTFTKQIYTATSLPVYPTNNGTVIGSNAINALAQYNTGEKSPVNIAGFNFVTTPAPGGTGWSSIAYGNGVWIAVAQTTSTTQGIARSIDGINWSFVTTTAPGGNWKSVAYGNGVWIAIAYTTSTTAGIARSTDNGLTWSFVTTPVPVDTFMTGWNSIAYGNGVWIAVAGTLSPTASGIVRSTDNGLTWNFITTPVPGGSPAPAVGWWSVAYGNGVWIAVAYTTSTTTGIARSTDNGLTWSFVTTTAPGGYWRSVVYGNGVWIVVANTTSTTAGIARSTDNGLTWSFVTTTAPGGNWISVAYGGGIWIAVAETTSTTAGIAKSLDGGQTWSFVTTTAPGGNWKSVVYNGKFVIVAYTTSTTAGITNLNLTSPSQYSLIAAGVGGRLGCFNNGNWANYNYPDFFTDDGTNMGSADINVMTVYNNILVTAGASGRVASMNSTTKYPYNGGTGIANNGTVIGANAIYALAEYQGSLIVAGATSVINSMSPSGGFNPFYNAGGIVVSNLLTGFNSLGYVYTYRYENGQYLINLVGNSLSKSYTLNNSTKDINIINAKYCIPQVSGGFTRHITSADDSGYTHIYDASSIKANGLVGYTDFSTYSGSIVYPSALFVLGNGNVLKSQAGWGVSDFTFRTTSSSTDIYNYCPQYLASTSGLYQVLQGNTNTLINAYGKLTNNIGITPSKPFEFRAGWTSGVQSFFSAALLDGYAIDSLGVIITNVGEIDDTYQPMIKDDDKILYSYNNRFIIKKIGTSIPDYIQKIDKDIYKINTLSPLNIIDANSNTLELGSIDFNNRMTFVSSSIPPVNSTKVSSIINGKYTNSIDTGDKLVTIASPGPGNINLIGYRIPVVATSIANYSVDTYIDDIYSFSTLNDGSELVVGSKQDTVYAATTIVPLAQGLEYNNGTVSVGGSTIFLKPEYDGYSIGNDITGIYDSFVLFGQLYLYDQKNIYAADVDSVTGIFNNKTLLTSAPGLKYIATAPTEVYFLSSFDNSIYKFNGGRTLDKFKRLNQLEAVNSGIYNTRDNSLLLDTDNTFIWVRDNIITQNNKLPIQTNLKYYDTEDGIVVGNNTSNWNYSYIEQQNSQIVPLSIQTPYYGFNTDKKSILSEYTVTIYNKDKDQIDIDGVVYSITENDALQQPVSWTIMPKDYYNGGYARIRIQPQVQRSLGTSLKLSTSNKIIIVSVVAQFKEGEDALVTKTRSR